VSPAPPGPAAGPRKRCSSSTSAGNVSALGVAAKRADRQLVGAGRAAEAEIDPPGIERLERAELLGDHERRVVGQHDPAGADPDRRVPAAMWAITTAVAALAIPICVVMLGEPEAVVAPALDVRARSSELRSASPGVEPSTIGARSRTESGGSVTTA
jgi:hypothetical protein